MSKINVPDKNLIATAFRKSGKSYEEHAVVQKEMGQSLLELLLTASDRRTFSRVLDVGCCTGYLTEQLCKKMAVSEIYLNDLVVRFCQQTSARVGSYVHRAVELGGDIEDLALPENLDLILSSATLQWIGNLPQLLHRFRTALKPDGLLAVSIFGPGTMREIRQLTGRGLAYLPEAQLLSLARKHFTVLASESVRRVLYFDTAREVLQHVQATGVGGVSRHRWTKSSMSHFAREYHQQFGHSQGLPVTYVATTFIGQVLHDAR
jgi:malonyl-CoA O-methyltransferase